MREYEKEILEKLTDSLNQYKSDEHARDPRKTLQELSQQKKEKNDVTKGQTLINSENDNRFDDLSKTEKSSLVSTPKKDSEITSSLNHMRKLTELHSKFDGKRE